MDPVVNESYAHQDQLSALEKRGHFNEKLHFLHHLIREKLPFLDRMSVARYDYEDNLLSTYSYSCVDGSPLTSYSANLSDIPSLQEILKRRRPRVINNMHAFESSQHTHSQKLLQADYQSSYTQPIICNEIFYGFLFFNSHKKNAFTEAVLQELDVMSHLLMLLVVNEWSGIEIMKATLRSAQHMTHHRDPETGGHLSRMSEYARMIARKLSKAYDIDDEYIEHLYLFSPLHDLGKIAIPDAILMKPDKLTEQEYETMKTHASIGSEMIGELLRNYNLGEMNYSQMLRNIAELHHEAIDGSGYPHGLKGDNIPFEARIVAVADVFDALTSVRPYKKAMTNHQAFDVMRQLSGKKLDPQCVQVLLESCAEIEEIQHLNKDEAIQHL